jgi:hypothetical protein
MSDVGQSGYITHHEVTPIAVGHQIFLAVGVFVDAFEFDFYTIDGFPHTTSQMVIMVTRLGILFSSKGQPHR